MESTDLHIKLMVVKKQVNGVQAYLTHKMGIRLVGAYYNNTNKIILNQQKLKAQSSNEGRGLYICIIPIDIDLDTTTYIVRQPEN